MSENTSKTSQGDVTSPKMPPPSDLPPKNKKEGKGAGRQRRNSFSGAAQRKNSSSASVKRSRTDNEDESETEGTEFSQMSIDELIKQNKQLIMSNGKLAKKVGTLSEMVESLSALISKTISQAENTERKLNSRMQEIEMKLANLTARVEDMCRNNVEMQPLEEKQQMNIGSTWSSVVARQPEKVEGRVIRPTQSLPSQQIELTNSVLAENLEREKKKESLIIFGLVEDSNIPVLNQVEKLFEKIGANKSEIEHVRRFRKTSSNLVAPVFIKLKQGSDRYRVIAAAKKLKTESGCKDLYICPDRTECERKLEKQLRERRDMLNREKEQDDSGRHYRWIVRGNEVRRVKQSSQ